MGSGLGLDMGLKTWASGSGERDGHIPEWWTEHTLAAAVSWRHPASETHGSWKVAAMVGLSVETASLGRDLLFQHREMVSNENFFSFDLRGCVYGGSILGFMVWFSGYNLVLVLHL